MPVKRPIFIPLNQWSAIDRTMNQGYFMCGRRGADVIARFEQRFRGRGLCIGVAMNGTERLAWCGSIADLFFNNDTHGGVDRILFTFAPTTKNDACSSDVFALDRRHKSALKAGYFDAMLCPGQSRRIVDHTDISSLELYHLAESLKGFAGCDDLLGEQFPFRNCLRRGAEKKHPCRQIEAEFAQILGSTTVQNFNALLHFERIAYHMAERLAHVGDERSHPLAHALAGFDHELREENCVFLFFHKCPRTSLHVQHEPISAFCQFLAHDRSANEIWTLDGCGDVAQRVQFSVSRGDFFSLTNHAATASLQNALKLRY